MKLSHKSHKLYDIIYSGKSRLKKLVLQSAFLVGKNMARSTLKRFYDSTAWKRQRMHILQRDNFTCTEKGCYATATEVHHIIELNEQNINDINITLNENNLRSLCHDCHTRITKQMKSGNKYQNVLKEIIFDPDGFPIEID